MNGDEALASGAAACSETDSGWTLYLQHSSNSSQYYYSLSPPPPNSIINNNNNNNNTQRRRRRSRRSNKKIISYDDDVNYNINNNNSSEEEEDLSMISDASSGPPHFDTNNHDVNADQVHNPNYTYKLAAHYNCDPKDDSPHLDDTASSPLFFSSPKKKNGGSGVRHQKVSSFESLIDYSNSPANHFQGKSTN